MQRATIACFGGMVGDCHNFFGNLTFRVHMEHLAEEEVIDAHVLLIRSYLFPVSSITKTPRVQHVMLLRVTSYHSAT
jgi:hypothetical protein